MATLTLNECQAARDCAKKFPPRCGHKYLAFDVPLIEADKPGIISGFSWVGEAVDWLKLHPEDLDKG
jgi:hypothetical protein